MITKKKRLTIEELQRMPRDRFPLQCTTDSPTFTGTGYETISILACAVDKIGHIPVMLSSGKYNLVPVSHLNEYPSFEPEEIEWFQVITMRKGAIRPESSRYLYNSKEDFLTTNGYNDSDYHVIDLIPVKKYPDYSKAAK